jgi:hypothetical protein
MGLQALAVQVGGWTTVGTHPMLPGRGRWFDLEWIKPNSSRVHSQDDKRYAPAMAAALQSSA